MLEKLKKIYESLPKEHLKFIKYIPDRVLFGKSFFVYRNRISFDKREIDRNLYGILKYAQQQTDFGKQYIPRTLKVENAKEILEDMPLVTSLDISLNPDYYISKEYRNRNSYYASTGGTGTGRNPTKVLLSNESYGIEWAHILHMWSALGYDKQKHLKLTLREKNLKGNKILEYNPVYNEIVVDPFKIKEGNAKRFIDEIRRYDFQFIHAYPSFLKEFMAYFKEYGYRPKIKGILLGSEGATKEDKKEFEEFFNTKVLHWYGLTEKVTLAADFDSNNIYKVYTSYGYPRIVDGELIATTFVNRAMPLINYKTGDGAEIFEDENHFYIKDLKGREGKDFVYVDEKKKIPVLCVTLTPELNEKILFYQTIQNEFGKIDILLLPKPHEKENIEKQIKELGKNATTLKDSGLDINFKLVTEKDIKRSYRGKLIQLVQNLKIDNIEGKQ